MKILHCPLNGPRNIAEFIYGGEYHDLPNPESSGSREWAEYVFFDDNHAGEVLEWWCHAATSYWFLVRRDTRSDEVVQTLTTEDFFAHGDSA